MKEPKAIQKSEEEQKKLKTIQELKGMEFFVPSYQRGYRWGKREVKALLEDIKDFQKQDNDDDSFYCLQPIVIKKEKDRYRVIDGQQRLTTIFLIIKALRGDDFFGISYETRNESENFLQNIQIKTESEANNLDFYHFWNAHKVIKGFFEKDNERQKEEFLKTLQGQCKVLWYEVGENENENDVFIRLNMGKIPLMETENIKALFLIKNNKIDPDALRERAEFWYEAEKETRENRDFRHCVLSKIDKKNIEHIKVDKDVLPVFKDDPLRLEPYLQAISDNKGNDSLFDYFYSHYKKGTLNERWEEFVNAVNTLSGFASREGSEKVDREIFHYFGFLIHNGEKIEDLYQDWGRDKDKKSFAKKLFSRVKKKVSSNLKNIEKLRYGKDNEEIKRILLLFNLELSIESHQYFDFNRYALEQWSLEHIYAQNSKSIDEAIKGKNDGVKEILSYIDDDELREEINEIKESKEKSNFKEGLLERIDEYFKNNDALHTIQNLALLDGGSNSSISNEIFSKKREEIQKLEEKNKFIPIATKKVFNKEFSTNKSNPNVFEKIDQKEYLEKIKKTLKKYIEEIK